MMASLSQIVTILLLLSCSLFGGYASMGLAYRDGFFDALQSCIEGNKCILLRSHTTINHSYTGITKIDHLAAVLLEFFAMGLTSAVAPDKVDWEAILTMGYMAAPFGGLWALMVMEGKRKKSGNALRRTGIFGMVFQLVTVTIVSPIYLALEVAQGQTDVNFDGLAISPRDLDAIPWGTTISFVLPTLGMIIPLINLASTEVDYLLIALWQPFPLYQTLIHPFLRQVDQDRSKDGRVSTTRYESSLARSYGFVLKLCAGTHLLVLAAAVLSQVTDSIPAISLNEILIPTSLSNPPTLATLSPPVSALDARSIVTNFLKWDIYCASAAFSIWAGYHTYHAEKGANVLGIAVRIIFWAMVGGPIAPAAVLLWDRDIAALEKAKEKETTVKRK